MRRALLLIFPLLCVTSSSAHAKKTDPGPQFDMNAAANALRSVELVKCKIAGGPRGAGHVSVTFGNDGGASSVAVDGGPFVGSPVERCIVAQYKPVKVPSFKGEPVKVGKTFHID